MIESTLSLYFWISQMSNDEQKGKNDIETPDYHVRPWMLPYLPKDPKWRDVVVLFVGMTIVAFVSISLAYFGQEVIAVVILAVGCGHFGSHTINRIIDRWKKRKGK